MSKACESLPNNCTVSTVYKRTRKTKFAKICHMHSLGKFAYAAKLNTTCKCTKSAHLLSRLHFWNAPIRSAKCVYVANGISHEKYDFFFNGISTKTVCAHYCMRTIYIFFIFEIRQFKSPIIHAICALFLLATLQIKMRVDTIYIQVHKICALLHAHNVYLLYF